ncbi:uncharacterized protein [Miscanthus floridulus]|uniref:uncharacterized protein isoform X1 n=1 Tax=Miscanthus floridulus TaxID=154761 RepID=UPI00345A0425
MGEEEMGNPDDQSGPGKYKLSVVLDDFTWKREDDTSFKVDDGEFNLGRDIDITTFAWRRLWNELEGHATIPSDVDIEVKMWKCKDMKVKTRDDLVFPHDSNFEGQDIVLHIKVVEKTGMDMSVGDIDAGTKRRKIDEITSKKTRKKSSKEKRQKTQASVSKQLSEACGLVNQRLICYANLVFQCYSFTEPLVSYLFRDDYGEDCGVSSKCFLCDLRRLIEDARTEEIIDPKDLTRHIKDLRGEFNKVGQQQDPHEFVIATNKLMETSSKKHG